LRIHVKLLEVVVALGEVLADAFHQQKARLYSGFGACGKP